MTAQRRAPGEGHWSQRPNGLLRYELGAGFDATGRRQRLVVYGRSKRACMEAMARKIETARIAGGIPLADDTTVEQYVTVWLARREREVAAGALAPATLVQYEAAIRIHIIPGLGRKRLDRLTVRDGDAWLAAMERAGVGGRARQYARMVLVAALNDALRLELIPRNPIALVRAPKHRRKDFAVWDVDDALRFLDAARTDRFAALWTLALTTGARPHELLGLRPADVAGDRLTIGEQLVRGGQERGPTKTRAARRTIALTPLAIRALTEHRRKMRNAPGAKEWLFPAPEGRAMNYRWLIARHYEPTIARAGVPRIRPYDLRHTYATLALLAGVPLHVVSRSLGHASAAFTAQVYAHVVNSLERQHVERVEALFGARRVRRRVGSDDPKAPKATVAP